MTFCLEESCREARSLTQTQLFKRVDHPGQGTAISDTGSIAALQKPSGQKRNTDHQ